MIIVDRNDIINRRMSTFYGKQNYKTQINERFTKGKINNWKWF